jgi:hypothetical protein
MTKQDLRDRTGRLIGRIKETSTGRLEIRTASGRLLGRYNPKNNQTRTASGKLVGKGNLLTTLLP